MVTLGLDASTTCVGYAFTKDKKILNMGFIDIKKEKTPKEKVEKVLEFLNKIPYIDDVTDINVEDNLSGFAGGRTSQQVIVKLAKFNAILCFMLEDIFEMEVYNPIKVYQKDDAEKNKIEISLELNKILESMVLRDPGQ